MRPPRPASFRPREHDALSAGVRVAPLRARSCRAAPDIPTRRVRWTRANRRYLLHPVLGLCHPGDACWRRPSGEPEAPIGCRLLRGRPPRSGLRIHRFRLRRRRDREGDVLRVSRAGHADPALACAETAWLTARRVGMPTRARGRGPAHADRPIQRIVHRGRGPDFSLSTLALCRPAEFDRFNSVSLWPQLYISAPAGLAWRRV